MIVEPGVSLKGLFAVFLPLLFLSLVSYRLKVLDLKGTILAVGTGLLIGIFGHPSWLVILLLFLIFGFMVTRFNYKEKHSGGTAEENRGTRKTSNVFYNGLTPTLIAVFSAGIGEGAAWIYLTAIAAAASDTFASEIGVLSDRVYMITNPSRNSMTPNPALRIKPGVDGGISLLGTVAALLASLLIVLCGWILIPWASGIQRTIPLLVLPTIFGFLGCHIDSILGATLERKGLMNKGQVNLAEITAASILIWCFI